MTAPAPPAAPAAGGAAPAQAPSGGEYVVEGFFCKKSVDRRQLQRDIEALEDGEAVDKEEKVRELKALLEESVEGIDPHKEAQELQNIFTNARRVIRIVVHPQPSLDDFSNSMRSARQRKVRGLHLTGHGTRRCGFYWLKRKDSSEYEAISLTS